MSWSFPLLTFDPDISSGHDSKNEEKQDEDECLQVVGRYSLHTIQDGPQQFPLASIEAGTEHITNTAIIGSSEAGCGLLWGSMLDDSRSSTDDMKPWVPDEVQDLFGCGGIERLFHLRDRLPRQ